METESYYLRHKIDQGLFVYLEIGETWEETFMMEFRSTDSCPHYIKSGALYEHRHMLIAFKWMALTRVEEILRDKKIEWTPIRPDEPLQYLVKTFKESYIKQS
jgi:hypothetical protein